jgi:multidrug efflux pump subunit AcrA (membrane-fusion protein)
MIGCSPWSSAGPHPYRCSTNGGGSIETAKARLRAIESKLQDRLIIAPFAGVVGLRNISVGALIEPGDLITTLDDDSVMKLDFTVPSIHLESLKTGLPIAKPDRLHSPGANSREPLPASAAESIRSPERLSSERFCPTRSVC